MNAFNALSSKLPMDETMRSSANNQKSLLQFAAVSIDLEPTSNDLTT